MPDSDKHFDVFLSHNSSDKLAVEELARKLTSEGLKPFLDKWHLIPGEPLQESLEEALDASSSCAVFLGPEGISPWQNEEMRVALEERFQDPDYRVIPILLPGSEEPEKKKLPRFLRRLAWVDFRSGSESENLHRLRCGILGLPPGPSAGSGSTTMPMPKAQQASGAWWMVGIAVLFIALIGILPELIEKSVSVEKNITPARSRSATPSSPQPEASNDPVSAESETTERTAIESAGIILLDDIRGLASGQYSSLYSFRELASRGLEIRYLSRSLEAPFRVNRQLLENYECLMLVVVNYEGNNLDFNKEEIRAIQEWVREDGGGLFLAALGWSWAAYSKKPIEENPVNKLASDFGIWFRKDYMNDRSTNRSPKFTPNFMLAGHPIIQDIDFLHIEGAINSSLEVEPPAQAVIWGNHDTYSTETETPNAVLLAAAEIGHGRVVALQQGAYTEAQYRQGTRLFTNVIEWLTFKP